MGRFSKFKLLFPLKLDFNWGKFLNKISQFGYFKKIEKLTKIGQGNDLG